MTETTHAHTHGDHHHHDAAPAEAGAAVAANASLALDIGEGRGALIIYPEERYRGLEIEISPRDGYGDRVHTGVHERTTVAGVTRLTAVFGSLEAGEYAIWRDADTEGPTVEVPDAGIAEIALS